MKFYKVINLNKFNTLRLDSGELVVDDVRMEMADKRGEGERWVESNSTITKAVPVQLTPSISTQQSSLRQRQDQLAREKESKKAVLLDTPPVTGKSGRTGIKKPPQPRPASVPTSSSTTASSTPTPTTHPDNLAHLKARLVQLLALKSVEASESASKLNAHPQDIQYLLNQVAYSQKSIQSSNPIFHLKHELWNDIEVDDWREYSDAEKQQVAAAVKRKTGKISQCIAGTIAPSNDKEKEKATTKKAAPAKTRQNLLRASQGKKVSRSPSPAKAMLNAKDASSSNTKDKDKEKEKEKEKEKDKDAQSSTSSRSPSVMSTHSSSTASKESSSKRKREDEAVKAARSTTAAQPKSESSKRMKKGEWGVSNEINVLNNSHR